jgi:hypothetical protein
VVSPDALRVAFYGGSTVFGFDVNDTETLPAALERALARRLPRPVAVWNRGVCAYTTGQASWLALAQLDRFAPDIVLVQVFNRGRRAWLTNGGADYVGWSRVLRDDATALENFGAPYFVPNAAHLAALRGSALYRAVAAAWRVGLGQGPMDARSDYGDAVLSRAWADKLVQAATAQGVRVYFVAVPERDPAPAQFWSSQLDAGDFWMLPDDDGDAETDPVHPPPEVLAMWGEWLADRLVLEMAEATRR